MYRLLEARTHQGDGKRACCNVMLAQYEAKKGLQCIYEIIQHQASVLSHGLLNLTKHKKCMYS